MFKTTGRANNNNNNMISQAIYLYASFTIEWTRHTIEYFHPTIQTRGIFDFADTRADPLTRNRTVRLAPTRPAVLTTWTRTTALSEGRSGW
jgi:hypothetical protein